MSALPPAELQRRFQAAGQALRSGRPREAQGLLEPVARAAPREPAVRLMLAQACFQQGDLDGAIREQRAAAALVPRDASVATGVGSLLLQAGRAGEGEAALRAALAIDRGFAPALAALAEHLVERGRSEDALAAVEASGPIRDNAVANAQAAAFKALGRKEESLAAFTRARDLAPQSGVAWHNVASAAGDLQRFAEAEAATAQAQRLGLDAPETWLVRARALQGLNRLQEAQAAFAEALRRRPGYPDAVREQAQLVWMRTGDADQALAAFDGPVGGADLRVDRARFLDYVGRRAEAETLLAAPAAQPDAPATVLAYASQLAVTTDPAKAASLAERALSLQPDSPDLLRRLAEARMAQGRLDDACVLLDRLTAGRPAVGADLTLQSTIWRLTGDPRGRALNDYAALVRARSIDAPPGWTDLPAYLADLAAALERLHVNVAHPIGQSLRGGAQTNVNLLETDEPAVRAFPAAIDGPIRAYMAELGVGDDPVRARNTGGYRLSGIWSVRLATGGRHADHMHPFGWLSSACYIAVPPVVDAGGREGWIKFGEPATPTAPPLGPEHFVKPEPGRLVLFPSYMWHGTVPFSGEHPRLTIAFDLLPA